MIQDSPLTVFNKNRKDSCSIIPFSSIKRKFLIIISWCMFQHKPSFGVQQLLFKNKFRQIINITECIRRARKNEIKFIGTLINKFKHIEFQHFKILKL